MIRFRSTSQNEYQIKRIKMEETYAQEYFV